MNICSSQKKKTDLLVFIFIFSLLYFVFFSFGGSVVVRYNVKRLKEMYVF